MALRGVRGLVSKKKRRFQEEDFDLDLTYITPNVIAMGFPSQGTEGMYRNPMPEVQRFFRKYHNGHVKVYNLCSERDYSDEDFGGPVGRFPFDDHNPCPLDLIAKFCADVDAWLAHDPENVIAVHCKAGKGRTGLMISAYLLHSGAAKSASAALNEFGKMRTSNGQGVTIPSQMRFVHYYQRVLADGPPAPQAVRITHIRMLTVPTFMKPSGCIPYFKVFVDGKKVFSYKKHFPKLKRYRVEDEVVDFDCSALSCLANGNVKITFHHDLLGRGRYTKICHLWFHTSFVTGGILALGKHVIDKACKDKSKTFDPNFALEIYVEKCADNGAALPSKLLHRVPEPCQLFDKINTAPAPKQKRSQTTLRSAPASPTLVGAPPPPTLGSSARAVSARFSRTSTLPAGGKADSRPPTTSFERNAKPNDLSVERAGTVAGKGQFLRRMSLTLSDLSIDHIETSASEEESDSEAEDGGGGSGGGVGSRSGGSNDGGSREGASTRSGYTRPSATTGRSRAQSHRARSISGAESIPELRAASMPGLEWPSSESESDNESGSDGESAAGSEASRPSAARSSDGPSMESVVTSGSDEGSVSSGSASAQSSARGGSESGASQAGSSAEEMATTTKRTAAAAVAAPRHRAGTGDSELQAVSEGESSASDSGETHSSGDSAAGRCVA